ncbi:rod-binding protein [Acetobacter sp. TBRC 12305]|uniref:Rod-binding protein n=1 Tax=Acetobacter garciniae TaxID=2817435 RepID=A0A939HP44_9PROT|nr:rod-binding protein [Acetobacter garciniae]MBO1324634.1 rod-binding protein [Acetobacter garciniae]MBX0344323.1 rod-binding protein [Acetobacter garciniae]
MSIDSVTAALSATAQAGGTQSTGLSASQMEQARKAAVEFEGMTIGELLQPMFDTVDTDDMFGGGDAEKQFRSLQVTELGKQIAHNGGIGMADSLYTQMLKMQEQAQAASQTRSHARADAAAQAGTQSATSAATAAVATPAAQTTAQSGTSVATPVASQSPTGSQGQVNAEAGGQATGGQATGAQGQS